MTSLARYALPTVTLAALLAACGGGGGMQLPPVIAPGPAVAGVNIAAAWRDYIAVAHTWTMRGKTTDARAFELSVVMKPGASGTFPLTGASGQTIDQSFRFAMDGAATVTSDGALFFAGDRMIGISTTDGACYAVRGASPALPASSAVGAYGTMFVLDGYAGCTANGQRLGSSTYSWSVETDGTLIMFCITSRQEDGNAAYIGTEVDCVEANANGTLGTRAKFTITRPDGNSITGRNF